MDKNISAEQKFTDMAAGLGLEPDTASAPNKPVIMPRRIGSTTYKVAVHFSTTSAETMGDKVTRLIRREAAGLEAAGL